MSIERAIVADTDLLRRHAAQVRVHATRAREASAAGAQVSAPADAFGVFCAPIGVSVMALSTSAALACAAIGPALDVTADGLMAVAAQLDGADAEAGALAETVAESLARAAGESSAPYRAGPHAGGR